MSNVTIAGGSNNLPVANSIDGSNDYLPIYTASVTATQAINRNTLLGLASAPVGLTDSQTLTNKTLTSPTINGATLSGTLSGTYTIGGTPTFPSSVVQLTSTQTLTNKTLTSPTINAPTITNATLSADTITGFTTSTTGTIYGLAITSGTISGSSLTSGSVTTSQIASATLTASNVNWTTSGQIWWQEMARQSISAVTNQTVSFTARQYLRVMIYISATSSASSAAQITFNGDSGANYAQVQNTNGTTANATSGTNIQLDTQANQYARWYIFDIINLSASEKVAVFSTAQQTGTGAGVAPGYRIGNAKWANTSTQISSLNIAVSAGTMTSGTIVVLGHD